MSLAHGHLARLLERVAANAPSLRRRQPALFESSGSEGPAPADVEQGSPSRVVAPVPSTTMPAPAGAQPRRDEAAAGLRPSTATFDGPVVDHTVRAVEVAVPAVLARHAPAAAAEPVTGLAPAAQVPRGQALPATSSARTPSDATEPPGPLRPMPAPPPVVAVATARAAGPVHAAPVAALPRTAVLPPRQAPAPARIAVHRPAPSATPGQASPAAAVEVTIGRIEIRAVPAPAAAPRARANAPRLGLDQYLRERGRR